MTTSQTLKQLLLRPGQSSSQHGNGLDIKEGPSSTEISDTLKRIRRTILVDGIPDDKELDQRTHSVAPRESSMRSQIWKTLLSIGPEDLKAANYLDLVGRGQSKASSKTHPAQVTNVLCPSWTCVMPRVKYHHGYDFSDDQYGPVSGRTNFKKLIKAKVSEEMVIRILEAMAWRKADGRTTSAHSIAGKYDHHGADDVDTGYVQGMNVLCAPFLQVCPSQVEAFACFSRLIERCIPAYVTPTLDGVHAGLKLLDRCLQTVDVELWQHLNAKGLNAELYAFASVLTLSACTPPLAEVIKLWDFLLAFGCHLNILCVIAQLLLMRQDLMDSPSPMKRLRTFPPIKAQSIIGITVALVKDIPKDLYAELVRHTTATR